jgi:hypothetical protein
MKVKQIVGAYTTYVSEEAKITKSDTTGVEITADEWDIAVMLPVESFAKAKKNKVWSESEDKF